MHGNIRNLDKFIARKRFLSDNKLGAETLSPGKEFQADTTRAENTEMSEMNPREETSTVLFIGKFWQ